VSRLSLSLSVILLGQLSHALAADWPHWRGLHRDDVSTESSGYDQDAWNRPIELWRAETGEGSSSPVVLGKFVYTHGYRDKHDVLECRDVETGKISWRQSWKAPRYGRKATGDQGLYSGPSSTPEMDRQTNRLFTLGADGELRAWDLNRNGALIWRRSLYDEFDIPQRPKVGRSGLRDYGFTTSPLVYGDGLLVEVGATSGSVIAFEQSTGNVLWKSEANHPPGHTGGLATLSISGIPCAAVQTFEGLLVVRLDGERAGKTVAEYPWKTEFANNIATPAVHDDSVILTSHYNHVKIARIKISLEGARLVWEQPYASKVCTPVIVDGHVYFAWRQVCCLDFETGKLAWQGGQLGDPGSLIATSDGRLILWSQRGTLSLLEQARRSPKEYKELAAHRILQKTDVWPHIVLAHGRLFAKDREGTLVCLRIN
jgi:outer membrane protein assembly factor BamB